MSIKVTFEFETAADAAAFLEDYAEGGIPAPSQAAKRGRPRKDAAVSTSAAQPAQDAVAAGAAPTPAVSAAPAAVPFKAVADAITALADKDMATAKAVLAQFGVAKASDLKPEQFGAVVEAATAKLSPTSAAPASLI